MSKAPSDVELLVKPLDLVGKNKLSFNYEGNVPYAKTLNEARSVLPTYEWKVLDIKDGVIFTALKDRGDHLAQILVGKGNLQGQRLESMSFVILKFRGN